MTVLALDISGIPRQWISSESAVIYYAKESVAWSMGTVVAKFRGGTQKDGTISYLETSSIIAVKGHGFVPSKYSTVSLTNRTLFGRDRHICAYCGTRHANANYLSRDHIVPRSRGGENGWMNVVTSCKNCNGKKGDRLLSECRMELLYVPYEPNHWENMILQNRNILSDQMDYLMNGIPKNSRLLRT